MPPGYTFEQCRDWIPFHSWPIERLYQWGVATGQFSVLDLFVDKAVNSIAGNVPDSTTLQLILDKSILMTPDMKHPDELVRSMQDMVSTSFPYDEFKDSFVPEAVFKKGRFAPPVRVVATLLCISLTCEEANRGDQWGRKHYRPGTQTKRAGCRMAHGIYLYRRHSDAEISQIATILKTAAWE